MGLTPGTRLGMYEVLAPLGVGGMGEVYRARDLKLGREVALKILPEEFAKDQDRLERLLREAQSLAERDPLVVWSRVIPFWDGIRANDYYREIERTIWGEQR